MFSDLKLIIDLVLEAKGVDGLVSHEDLSLCRREHMQKLRSSKSSRSAERVVHGTWIDKRGTRTS